MNNDAVISAPKSNSKRISTNENHPLLTNTIPVSEPIRLEPR